jgi:hypothetical protein
MEDSRGAVTAAAGAASSSRTAATTSADTESDHHHQRAQAQAYPEHGSWLCCVPCYWLRRNNSVHKASLTVATLIVTSLLVASPVLFLISSLPSREGDRTRDCHHQVRWLISLLKTTIFCRVMPCILVEYSDLSDEITVSIIRVEVEAKQAESRVLVCLLPWFILRSWRWKQYIPPKHR